MSPCIFLTLVLFYTKNDNSSIEKQYYSIKHESAKCLQLHKYWYTLVNDKLDIDII
jgi:hypothetical protein